MAVFGNNRRAAGPVESSAGPLTEQDRVQAQQQPAGLPQVAGNVSAVVCSLSCTQRRQPIKGHNSRQAICKRTIADISANSCKRKRPARRGVASPSSANTGCQPAAIKPAAESEQHYPEALVASAVCSSLPSARPLPSPGSACMGFPADRPSHTLNGTSVKTLRELFTRPVGTLQRRLQRAPLFAKNSSLPVTQLAAARQHCIRNPS